MTDTIILGYIDGEYCWLCPNCNERNVGLDPNETVLADYLPTVRCSNCGFQFAIYREESISESP